MRMVVRDVEKEEVVNLGVIKYWEDDFDDNQLAPEYEVGSYESCGANAKCVEQNGRLEITAEGSGGGCSEFVWLNKNLDYRRRIIVEFDVMTLSISGPSKGQINIHLFKASQKDYATGDRLTIFFGDTNMSVYKRIGGVKYEYIDTTSYSYPGDGHYKIIYDLNAQRIQIYKDGSLIHDIDMSSDPFEPNEDLTLNIAIRVDADGDTLTMGIDNLQVYTDDVPLFAISSAPSTVSVGVGSSFTVNVTIRNDGRYGGDVEVRIKDHYGNVVNSQRKTVGAGSSETVTLTVTAPSSPGNYTWSVEAYNVDTGEVDDTATFTVSVTSPGYELAGGFLTVFMQLLPFIIMLMVFVMLISALTSALR